MSRTIEIPGNPWGDPPRDAVDSTALGPHAAASPDRDAILATSLWSLDLPTRMMNFILDADLETLGDLMRRAPEDVLRERNIGRGTIEVTRRVIEQQTGLSWRNPARARDLTRWDVVCAGLTDTERAMPLARMVLPIRVRARALREGLVTLGDLAQSTSC